MLSSTSSSTSNSAVAPTFSITPEEQKSLARKKIDSDIIEKLTPNEYKVFLFSPFTSYPSLEYLVNTKKSTEEKLTLFLDNVPAISRACGLPESRLPKEIDLSLLLNITNPEDFNAIFGTLHSQQGLLATLIRFWHVVRDQQKIRDQRGIPYKWPVFSSKEAAVELKDFIKKYLDESEESKKKFFTVKYNNNLDFFLETKTFEDLKLSINVRFSKGEIIRAWLGLQHEQTIRPKKVYARANTLDELFVIHNVILATHVKSIFKNQHFDLEFFLNCSTLKNLQKYLSSFSPGPLDAFWNALTIQKELREQQNERYRYSPLYGRNLNPKPCKNFQEFYERYEIHRIPAVAEKWRELSRMPYESFLKLHLGEIFNYEIDHFFLRLKKIDQYKLYLCIEQENEIHTLEINARFDEKSVLDAIHRVGIFATSDTSAAPAPVLQAVMEYWGASENLLTLLNKKRGEYEYKLPSADKRKEVNVTKEDDEQPGAPQP